MTITNHSSMQMSKNQVLRQRTITGIFFAIGVVLLLFSGKIGAIAFGCFIAGFSCYEYIRMVFHKNKKKLISSLLAVAVTIILLTNHEPDGFIYKAVCIFSMLCFLAGIVHLFYPFVNHKLYYWMISIVYFGLPLGLFVSYIYHTDQYYPAFWMAIIIFIWIADSGAYLIGSRIGKRLLFESISPKKTWEGFIGAGIVSLVAAWVFSEYFTHWHSATNTGNLFYWMAIAFIAWFVGTLGDLVESSIKRTFNIKDSGKLLPGHGGVFDRFDSFIYILPFILTLTIFFKF